MKKIQSFLILIFVLTSLSCGDNGNAGPEEPINNFDRKAMLIDFADGIIIPAYNEYVQKLEILNNFAQSFVQDPTVENLEALRGYWLDAYKSWQYVSMFDIGKAEEISLRNFTNIFPTNPTEIEENIISGIYNLELPSKYDEQGFPALDYLLYGIGENSESIVSKYLEPSKAKYLTDLTDKLEVMAASVLNDWNDEYRESFIVNDGISATSSVNKLVNDYLLYYEKYLRAGKIGIPAGVFSGDPLSEKVEGYYAEDISKILFLTGLDACKRFFNGKNFNTDSIGSGFKSYLDYLNTIKEGADLSQLINDQFDATQQTASQLDDNFVMQIQFDNSKMLATYDELQKNVILLKVDMLQALNIKIDFVDSDGD